jgi:hypothetical protein
LEPAPELLTRISELERRVAGLTAERDVIQGQFASTARDSRDAEQRLAGGETALQNGLIELASEQRRFSALQQDVDRTRETLLSRQAVLAEAVERKPAVRQIRQSSRQ